MQTVIEATYPLIFRREDAETLGHHIRDHHSVVLIGMKRVGISNFLRFFLHHPQVKETYIGNDSAKQLFVSIDLNNLVERTSLAFWMLTFKRIIDVIEHTEVNGDVKQKSQSIFNQAIQLNDTFFVLDAVQKVLRTLHQQGFYTTLFFLRFDRLQDMITPEFFANIQAVKDEALSVSYVFTSYRPLHELVPDVFTRSALSVFTQEMYLKPTTTPDMRVVLATFTERYDLNLPDWTTTEVLRLADGHVQYLHLALIFIRQHGIPQPGQLEKLLSEDEETTYLSEELWASLKNEEQQAIASTLQAHTFSSPPKYLTETGILKDSADEVLNPLFTAFVRQTLSAPSIELAEAHDLSRKEHLLFTLLEDHLGELVERETIIQVVWTDEAELGVSDWAIDRLIARLRAKLRTQQPSYKILTVITRGYKLLKE